MLYAFDLLFSEQGDISGAIKNGFLSADEEMLQGNFAIKVLYKNVTY